MRPKVKPSLRRSTLPRSRPMEWTSMAYMATMHGGLFCTVKGPALHHVRPSLCQVSHVIDSPNDVHVCRNFPICSSSKQAKVKFDLAVLTNTDFCLPNRDASAISSEVQWRRGRARIPTAVQRVWLFAYLGNLLGGLIDELELLTCGWTPFAPCDRVEVIHPLDFVD